MVGGTGQKLQEATVIVAGVASLVATLMSIVSIWLQAKNYRKPLLQRYVVRILLMVPIYSISSWSSMMSTIAAQCLDPIRDIYEAFTIYTFFQLLINYLDGERALIIMTHGREPISHMWPVNHILPPVDISDPYTFLGIKRGILQYALLKPLLGLAAIIMKATGTYQEGYIGLKSGYFWSGLIYNMSVTISLYSLGLFWVCMHEDLKPFRPVPKFLCVKLIIFASYWQGFFLSILVFLGALPDDVQGYTPDNLAAAIQDALICIEMPAFAVAHWYAFSWHDFADNKVSAARLPVKYALRDAFGIRDLIEDSKLTFRGDNYAYRDFDSNDKIMAHESSRSRMARLKAGMRYERGGKGKYWISSPDKISTSEVDPYTPLLGGGQASSGPSQSNANLNSDYDIPGLDPDMEQLYDTARQLEYGDWNYPVINANILPREQRWRTTSHGTYQHVPNYYSPATPVVGSSNNFGAGSGQNGPPAVSTRKTKGKQKQNASASSKIQTSAFSKAQTSAPKVDASSSQQKSIPEPRGGAEASSIEPSVPSAQEPQESEAAGGDENESSRLWQQSDEASVTAAEGSPVLNDVTSRYDLGGDEFRNVWGAGGSQSER